MYITKDYKNYDDDNFMLHECIPAYGILPNTNFYTVHRLTR